MNSNLIKWGIACLTFFTFLLAPHSSIQAQKVMATLNFKGLGITKAEAGDSTVIDYDRELSVAANIRFFEKNQWAFRLGAGFNKLEYNILGDDGITANFDVARKSMTAFIGVEKHFGKKAFRPFVGVFVPLTFNGDDQVRDIFSDFSEQIDNGGLKTGFAVLTGLNVRLFRVLNIGVEFNAGFDRFKSEVLDNLTQTKISNIKLRNLDYNTEFVIGVAF